MVNDKFSLKTANMEDIPVLLEMIKQLARYEKLEDQVEATEEILRESLFVKKTAHALIAEYSGLPVGYALYFYNFSTFTGKPGIYLEDLYICPEMRGRGYGKRILTLLAKKAVDSGCTRVEWSCLNWNEPSREFYKKLGAIEMGEWTVFRLHKDALQKLANSME